MDKNITNTVFLNFDNVKMLHYFNLKNLSVSAIPVETGLLPGTI